MYKIGNIKIIAKNKGEKRHQTISKPRPDADISKYSSLSKEAQILSCIRNISPYLSNKITSKDYKNLSKAKHTAAITLTQRNGSELSIKPELSFDNGKAVVSHSTKNPRVDSNIILGNLSLRKKSQARNDSQLSTLPPIVNEHEGLYKETNTTKAQSTSSVLPEFKFTQKQNIPN